MPNPHQNMKNEESVGCVMIYEHVFDEGEQEWGNPKRKKRDLFLLMQSPRGDWNFVKGHREYGESDEETLRREVYEETRIRKFKILGFVGNITYSFLDKAGRSIKKEVSFYLALSDTTEVTLSSEHINFKWAEYKDAIGVLSFNQSISILNKAVKMKNGNCC
jgi:tRNA nucleotidyltransferase (CCA-adding enzyme)